MTQTEIARIRLSSQKISASEFNCAPDVISWMGAIQAQDFAMSQWATGLRYTGSSSSEFMALLNFNLLKGTSKN